MMIISMMSYKKLIHSPCEENTPSLLYSIPSSSSSSSSATLSSSIIPITSPHLTRTIEPHLQTISSSSDAVPLQPKPPPPSSSSFPPSSFTPSSFPPETTFLLTSLGTHSDVTSMPKKRRLMFRESKSTTSIKHHTELCNASGHDSLKSGKGSNYLKKKNVNQSLVQSSSSVINSIEKRSTDQIETCSEMKSDKDEKSQFSCCGKKFTNFYSYTQHVKYSLQHDQQNIKNWNQCQYCLEWYHPMSIRQHESRCIKKERTGSGSRSNNILPSLQGQAHCNQLTYVQSPKKSLPSIISHQPTFATSQMKVIDRSSNDINEDERLGELVASALFQEMFHHHHYHQHLVLKVFYELKISSYDHLSLDSAILQPLPQESTHQASLTDNTHHSTICINNESSNATTTIGTTNTFIINNNDSSSSANFRTYQVLENQENQSNCRKEVKQYVVLQSTTLERLIEILMNSFDHLRHDNNNNNNNNPSNQSFSLKYLDMDYDWICITDEESWRTAVCYTLLFNARNIMTLRFQWLVWEPANK